MKIRAAIMATLTNFVVCIFLLSFLSFSVRSQHNEIIKEEITLTCRLSTEMLNSAAFQDIPAYLNGIAEDSDMEIAYFAVDKTVAYKSFDFEFESPSGKELSAGKEGTVIFERRDDNGRRLLFVAMRMADGGVLCFGAEKTSWYSALGHYSWVYVLAVISALVVQYIITVRAVGRSDDMVDSIMDVLEDFTEGNFDSRIQKMTLAPPLVVAKYNATLARVQDRVFRQMRRNLVFGQMINQMNNGLMTVDKDMNINFTSNMVGKLFGVHIDDTTGVPLASVIHNEDLENILRKAMDTGAGNVCTESIDGKREDGTSRPLRVYASALFREGKTTGAMAIIEDVTEIRKLEQLRTDFAANVSHEMKTPLTSIKGFVETLQAGAIEKPEMAHKFLDIIMVEADRLTRLINDILSITKLESGNEEVEIKRIPLDRAVMEVCDLLKIHADDKQVTIKASPNPKPSFVMGNPDRVKQLAINLIENGIKYNKVGGMVRVKVMEDAGNVYLTVSDTGIGIREENLPRLFERFYRVDKGRSRAMGGTGLGLAIVKHIVNTMNGTIEVHSKYGEGTEFLVTFPKAPEEEPAETASDAE